MIIDEQTGYLQSIYYDAIQEFIVVNKKFNRLPDIIRNGLNVFIKFPNSVSTAIYLLKNNSFEFELNSYFPESEKNNLEKIFNSCVHNGIVGSALANGSISFGSSGFDELVTIAVPLVASFGVLGIALINTNDDTLIKTELNIATTLFSRVLSASLENVLLQHNLKATKSSLEQMVAAKTMDLAQSRRELNAIFDAVQTGIIVHDWDTFEITKINPVAEGLINLDGKEILGRKIHDFLEKIDYNDPDFSSESYKNFESYLINTNGDKIPIIRTTSFVSIGSAKKRIDCFIDITELKKYQEELKQINQTLELKVEERTQDLQILVKKLKEEIDQHHKVQQELKLLLDKEKELSQLKTRFVSMVSHEFRTPLTIVRSAAQMLEKYQDSLSDEERQEYLNRIMKTVDNLTDLIENMLFISREKEKVVETDITEQIDLIKFTENLINEFQTTLLQRRDIFFINIGYKNTVETNERLLRLILLNLLSNAAKYSSPDTPIDVKLYFNEDNFAYAIRDYGIGIPDDEQEKIFDLFYRAENVGKVSGSGIGLQVVLNAIKMLNGRLDFTSKINRGTTFTVTIPYSSGN
ncbi:MAG TPA: ATP-binding protein [Candidatus Kapabacteria bacterium]|nr:ATP-binding protein [Candidatus Kapabacteria bacterium]